jgi:hypothetical protein
MANKIGFGFDVNDGGAVRKLNGISNAFDKIGGKGSGASLFGNVGAKAVAAGFNLISGAADKVVGFLDDSVHAFIEDQASIAELDTALRANVKEWKGSTQAIEENNTKKMEWGFTDEEQRHAMSLLVVATGNVTKSQDIMSTAMDLARLKHISLEEATTALIKVDDGHYRALQALGIVLPKNATSEQALTAVRKAAEGQAASYAATTEGKLTVAQVKFGEAMEKIGGTILPVLATIMTKFADDWLPALGRGWDKVTTFVNQASAAIGDVIDKIARGIKVVQEFLGSLYQVHTAQQGIDYHTTGQVPHHAAGGWVGLNGPELSWVGEKGPEYISPARSGGPGSSSGFTIQGVSEQQLVDMVDRGLYFKLQRSSPSLGRP